MQPSSKQQFLFAKGKAVLASLAGEQTAEEISLDRAWNLFKKDSQDTPDQIANEIIQASQSYFVASDIFPRNQDLCNDYRESARLTDNPVNQLINDIEDDPHLKKYLVDLYDLCIKYNIDPGQGYTTTAYKSEHLIFLGTGSGLVQHSLIKLLEPKLITVIVDDWHDWASSFFEIDWLELWNQYCLDPAKRISAISAQDSRALQSYISQNLLPVLDHALVYQSPVISQSHNMLKNIFSDGNLQRQINYLGFIMDEYNMIFNAAKALAKKPRVFNNPQSPGFGGRFLVCASGPSLDVSLPEIQRLSSSAIVVACASSYGTLRRAGIRVDFLCLLERGDFMIEQYTEAVKKFGDDHTRLLASVTTPPEIHDLFKQSCIYFRPALTPVSIFAENINQVLNYEGPQTVNTGVAFSLSLGASEIILCGSDLGVRSLCKVRSQHAIGDSPREFNIQMDANKGGTAYTNMYLLDGQAILSQVAEICKDKEINLLNASDGIKIDGWHPVDLSSLDHIDVSTPMQRIEQWWSTRPFYNIELTKSMWLAANPRASLFAVVQQINELLMSDKPFYPVVILEIFNVLKIHDTNKFKQTGPRIIRGQVLKALMTLYRQTIVIRSQNIDPTIYEADARKILADHLSNLTNEILYLFDIIEEIID